MAVLSGELNEARLRELCAQECPESQTLEFKRTLPEKGDRDKAEFLKDVCALANSDGGDLVYGIDEADGKAKDIVPITSEPADAAKRRLGQVIDAGIEPRIVGLQLSEVIVAGGYVLRLTVPASFNGPHRYSVNSPATRFVMRTGTHISDLTYGQLRGAFDRTATLTERARQFRAERIQAIRDRTTWKPIRKGPVCAVHVIPIATMAENRNVDIRGLRRDAMPMMFREWGSASCVTNLDGVIAHPGVDENGKEVPAYVQVFRNGSLEAARIGGRLSDSAKIIPSSTISGFYRAAVDKLLSLSRSLDFAGPAIVGGALLTVSGYAFGVGPWNDQRTTDRSDLILPEIWIDQIEAATVADDIARPLLDILWQAYDIDRCWDYSEDGKWQPNTR